VTPSQHVTRAQALQKSREFQSELQLKFVTPLGPKHRKA
jgi:hypothetical protein